MGLISLDFQTRSYRQSIKQWTRDVDALGEPKRSGNHIVWEDREDTTAMDMLHWNHSAMFAASSTYAYWSVLFSKKSFFSDFIPMKWVQNQDDLVQFIFEINAFV